jgi:hypothetical protein
VEEAIHLLLSAPKTAKISGRGTVPAGNFIRLFRFFRWATSESAAVLATPGDWPAKDAKKAKEVRPTCNFVRLIRFLRRG